MNIKKILFSGITSLAVIAGIIGFNTFNSNELPVENSSDTLAKLLSSTNIDKNNLSADFLTGEVSKYTGITSPAIEACKNNLNINANESDGEITAQFNILSEINQSRSEILEDITPIFGYAVKNSEINWIYNKVKKEYTFFTHKDDVVFWKCYFRKETTFFKEFFVPESIMIDVEKIPMPTLMPLEKRIDVFLSATEEPISTEESFRNRTEKTSRNIPLAYLNATTQDKFSRIILNKLSNHPDVYIDLQAEDNYSPVSSSETPRTSSYEVMRSEKYPFLSINIYSSSESLRKNAANSIETLSVSFGGEIPVPIEVFDNYHPQVTPSFSSIEAYRSFHQLKFTLNSHEELPAGVFVQLDLDIDRAQNNSEFFEISEVVNFVGTNNGPNIEIVDSNNFCTEEYDPVCGEKKYECDGEICLALESELITYSNMCELENDGALFSKYGKCEDENFDAIQLINKTATQLNKHVCSEKEKLTEEFAFTGRKIDICEDTIAVYPPAQVADMPTTYYVKNGESFYCGGFVSNPDMQDPRCNIIPKTCKTSKYALCQNI